LGVVLIVSAGCATVTSYQKPITDFATATASAESTLATLNQSVTAAYAARLEAEVNEGKFAIQRKGGDCELTSPRCRLQAIPVSEDASTKATVPYPPEPLLGNVVTLMAGISAYSEGLTAIVNADTAQQVAASVDSAMGSIESLAGSIAEISGKPVSSSVAAYATPTGKALNWITGQYIAKIQLDGLRQATERANPVIQRSVEILDVSAELADVNFQNDEVKRLDAAELSYETEVNNSNPGQATALTNLVAAASKYDQVLTSASSTVYSAMSAAHATLTDNLNNKSKTVVEVIAAIEEFSAQAATVAEIIQEFTDADGE
jgi:hypothetical protein